MKQNNTSLAVKGALVHCLHRLQNPKWPPGGPKMSDGVGKGVYPQVFGHSKQLSHNKFFDPSTPSMRKDRDGKRKEKREKKNRENSGHYVIASSQQPEHRPMERRKLVPKVDLREGDDAPPSPPALTSFEIIYR